MVNILDSIYKNKKPDDIVILSAGHGGLALYTVLEKF
jgi:transketolase N-terminal domain/subunit